MKSAIKLGKHKIEYQPLKAIKGQVLVDFLVETCPMTEIEDPNKTQDLMTFAMNYGECS